MRGVYDLPTLLRQAELASRERKLGRRQADVRLLRNRTLQGPVDV